jgi:hypothetical protein
MEYCFSVEALGPENKTCRAISFKPLLADANAGLMALSWRICPGGWAKQHKGIGELKEFPYGGFKKTVLLRLGG